MGWLWREQVHGGERCCPGELGQAAKIWRIWGPGLLFGSVVNVTCRCSQFDGPPRASWAKPKSAPALQPQTLRLAPEHGLSRCPVALSKGAQCVSSGGLRLCRAKRRLSYVRPAGGGRKVQFSSQ